MVAKVRNLTSSSSTAEYFHEEGGYYAATGGDREAARAKAAEHRLASAWHGQALAALGLKEGQKVSATTFETILRGHVLGTNIRLGRKRDGKHEHRPGFDITFSAPKSVSLAALLPTRKHPRGDRGVLRCHDEAVKATLDWIEETKLQTRGYDPATGRRPRVKGHGMAAALFRHIASRNLDPQLHTHAVVANMTRDGEGRWKSVEPTELHRNAILFGAYYRDQLARRLIAKGYSVLPAMAGRMRSFEIAGYDRRIQTAFSSRSEEMKAYMDEQGWDHSQATADASCQAHRRATRAGWRLGTRRCAGSGASGTAAHCCIGRCRAREPAFLYRVPEQRPDIYLADRRRSHRHGLSCFGLRVSHALV